MARRRLTGQTLAARLGRSQNYVAKRLRDESPLTLNDIEAFADALGTAYERLIGATLERMRKEDSK